MFLCGCGKRSVTRSFIYTTGFGKCVQKTLRDSFTCSGKCLKNAIISKVPILSWLPEYSPRQSLMGDLIAGVTVAIMHIPQGTDKYYRAVTGL